jgi:hypothetical protein
MKRKIFQFLVLFIALTLLAAPVSAQSLSGNPVSVNQQTTGGGDGAILTTSDGPEPQSVKTSPRLIVELTSPPLSVWSESTGKARLASGKVDYQAAAAQAYLRQLKDEQASFVSRMQAALPDASVGQYIDGQGAHVDLTYQVSFNGLAVDPGTAGKGATMKTLLSMPGVKAVFYDYAHQPELYASIPLINAASTWNNPAIGGMANAGAGIKVASMDGGVYHGAPMFDGTGYSYPSGYPAGGLGLTANNNGKIIASRVYFRTWDPPTPEDNAPWAVKGTTHGSFTASIAAGEQVDASYLGITETISGVAPKAWIMSYRVFYDSITHDEAFYTAEGIAALEDIMKDGADVLNNSWGGGPGSIGGEFDPLDQALINVADSGTFVSMSAGNAGPNNGTTDHPSDAYIDVAASSTDGTLASGRLSVTAPTPVTDTLKNMPFTSASFGSTLPAGGTFPYLYLPAAAVNPANVEGCNPWPAGTFTGKAALISRGTCEFGLKVLNAENAGASFVIVYNHASGGDTLLNMGAGAVGGSVTIPSVFIWHSKGVAMVDWYNTYGSASEVTMDTTAYQAGNTPDVIASFSSRGPGVGNVLKPDITAPGVNILAQGYTPGATGVDRNLGWGQQSGTSFSAPHVAGAAALLRQIHPDWTNAEIKSALMTTSKYMGIWNGDGTPAQPLDMGAGRLDLTHAADPGVILSPPSVGFGQMVTGTVKSEQVTVTSVATTTETYDLSTIKLTGAAFTYTVGTLPGFSVNPSTITLTAGSSAMITVTFDTAAGAVIGDNQGFVVLDGTNYDAHMPVWARVAPTASADVLIIDNDGSSSFSFTDYVNYYTTALTNLGMTYDVLDVDNLAGSALNFLPSAAVLSSYKAIIYFTGDDSVPNGFIPGVPTPLTAQDMDRLTEYANQGGKIFAMGQDMASVLNSTSSSSASFFYSSVLGGDYLQDSVTHEVLPSQLIGPRPDSPSSFHDLSLDLGGPKVAQVTLTGANEVPPVATSNQGKATFALNAVSKQLDYDVTITVSNPITITASHIHTGAAGVNGPVLYPLFTTPTLVTDTLNFNGSVVLTNADVTALASGGLYINVHSNVHLAGELRAQVEAAFNGDGAGNQYFIDELKSKPTTDTLTDTVGTAYPYTALLQYPGPYNVQQGTVALAHRDQPTLENPGLAYLGRSIYTTFGLEGVNNGTSSSSREDLLQAFFNWSMDEPTVTISDVTQANATNLTVFQANVASDVAGTTGSTYRWDFGDGSAYSNVYTSSTASHTYASCGNYTVRVEATDSWGNKAIGTYQADVTSCVTNHAFLPYIGK